MPGRRRADPAVAIGWTEGAHHFLMGAHLLARVLLEHCDAARLAAAPNASQGVGSADHPPPSPP